MAFQRNAVSRLASSEPVPRIVFAPPFLRRGAWSQTAPIKIVVPPAGGVADGLTRLLGEATRRKQPDDGDRKSAGATTVIGTDAGLHPIEMCGADGAASIRKQYAP